MYLIFVFLFSRGMYLLLVKRYYNLSIKGEKYQLDLSKLLMSWSDYSLSQSKYQSILINCRTEKQNKNKSKKRFAGVTEKYLKTEESLNTYDGKLFKRN